MSDSFVSAGTAFRTAYHFPIRGFFMIVCAQIVALICGHRRRGTGSGNEAHFGGPELRFIQTANRSPHHQARIMRVCPTTKAEHRQLMTRKRLEKQRMNSHDGDDACLREAGAGGSNPLTPTMFSRY